MSLNIVAKAIERILPTAVTLCQCGCITSEQAAEWFCGLYHTNAHQNKSKLLAQLKVRYTHYYNMSSVYEEFFKYCLYHIHIIKYNVFGISYLKPRIISF